MKTFENKAGHSTLVNCWIHNLTTWVHYPGTISLTITKPFVFWESINWYEELVRLKGGQYINTVRIETQWQSARVLCKWTKVYVKAPEDTAHTVGRMLLDTYR